MGKGTMDKNNCGNPMEPVKNTISPVLMNPEGKVLIRCDKGMTAEQILALEIWMNDYISTEAYAKFGCGLRFHLSAKMPLKIEKTKRSANE